MIREAETRDVPALMELRLSVRENILSDPSLLTEDLVRASLTSFGRGWVVEDDGQILGFSIAIRKDASIWALFVRPGFEGRGIGRQLLAVAVEWLWQCGADRVILSTDPGTRAERFYRSQGWQVTGTNQKNELCFELPRPAEAPGGEDR